MVRLCFPSLCQSCAAHGWITRFPSCKWSKPLIGLGRTARYYTHTHTRRWHQRKALGRVTGLRRSHAQVKLDTCILSLATCFQLAEPYMRTEFQKQNCTSFTGFQLQLQNFNFVLRIEFNFVACARMCACIHTCARMCACTHVSWQGHACA